MPNYVNSYDKDQKCAIQGEKAEVAFKNILIKEGYEVRDATRADQLSHVDLIALKNNQKTTYDIKSRKKISRQDEDYTDEFVWVEIMGDYNGNLGWLFGAADRIIFERKSDFVEVDREKLVSFVKTHCNMRKFVTQAKDALYSNYKRFGRSGQLSLIKGSDIESLAKKIYNKIPLTDSQNAPKIGV